MRDQDIQDLLRAAESNLDKPPLDTAQFAWKVRERHRRGKRRLRTVAALAPLALLAVVWTLRPATPEPPRKLDASLADNSEAPGGSHISDLIAQAEFHRQVATRINQLVKRDRASGATTGGGSELPEIREQLEVVAYRMILRADALRAVMQPADEALVIYQDIVRLFPNTHSAELARQRLADLGISRGAT
jgi:hypothetical protein